MSSDPTGPGLDERPALPTDQARDYLLDVLRATRAAVVQDGADPAALTAGLQERLRTLRAEPAASNRADC